MRLCGLKQNNIPKRGILLYSSYSRRLAFRKEREGSTTNFNAIYSTEFEEKKTELEKSQWHVLPGHPTATASQII